MFLIDLNWHRSFAAISYRYFMYGIGSAGKIIGPILTSLLHGMVSNGFELKVT